MDARALRELELLPVVRLYSLDGAGALPAAEATAAAGMRALVADRGAASAPWLFVAAQVNGADPFQGAAGKLVDGMLASVGCARDRELSLGEIDSIKSCMIVALGEGAANELLGGNASLASRRGRVLEYRGLPVVVTWHPADLLRDLPQKAQSWEDLVLALRTSASA